MSILSRHKITSSEIALHPKQKMLDYISQELLFGVPLDMSEVTVEKPLQYEYLPSREWIALCEEQGLGDEWKSLSKRIECEDFLVTAELIITITDTSKLARLSKKNEVISVGDCYVLLIKISSNPFLDCGVKESIFNSEELYYSEDKTLPSNNRLLIYIQALIAEFMADSQELVGAES